MHETISFNKVELSERWTAGTTGIGRKGGFDAFRKDSNENSSQLGRAPTWGLAESRAGDRAVVSSVMF